MPVAFHKRSFLYGILCALLLAALLGAARENLDQRSPQYDATPVGGSGLQIVSHGTNTLYNYKRELDDDVVKYRLVESIDLSVAGRAEILAKQAK